MTTKLDLKKDLKHLYAPSARDVSAVDVPPISFLMVDGSGNPNTAQSYSDAVSALFSTAYTLKFMLKNRDAALDYAVMPLEGLWWADDMDAFRQGNKDQWLWTMMIAQPEFVTPEDVQAALGETRRKKPLPALDLVRFEAYHEGPSVQILHLGPYADETANIARLHGWIADHGYTFGGKHHEIYLNDASRVVPEKLRTVVRQPYAKGG
jgi:hypothetical protein